MKIVVTAKSPSIEAEVDPRFGRCAYFVIVDPETLEFEAHQNPALSASGGAGTQAVQFLVKLGIDAAISGDFGPNAFSALKVAGIDMYKFTDHKTVRGVIKAYQSNELEAVNEAGVGHKYSPRG